MRKQLFLGIGTLCVLVGGLWTGQGLGWIGGSGMSGKAMWALIGVVLMFLGAGLITVALRDAERRH